MKHTMFDIVSKSIKILVILCLRLLRYIPKMNVVKDCFRCASQWAKAYGTLFINYISSSMQIVKHHCVGYTSMQKELK